MKNRFYQLDLFRLVSALMVVFYHYFYRGYTVNNLCLIEFEDFKLLAKYGYIGVDLFFIISGFVIPLSIEHFSIKKFWISRISRLFPTYWLAVTLTTLMILFFDKDFNNVRLSFKNYLLNLTMFQNYFGIENIDGVYWSLFVEMKFYIFIITPFLFLKKFFKINLIHLVISWFILALLITYLRTNSFFIFLGDIFFIEWSSYFMAGITFYYIYKNGFNLFSNIFLLFILSLSIYYVVQHSFKIEKFCGEEFSENILVSIVVFFYILMYLFVGGRLHFLNLPSLTILGSLTYPLYLIHQNIGYLFMNYFGLRINKYGVVFLLLLIILFVSRIIYRYYETYISNLIRKKLNLLLY